MRITQGTFSFLPDLTEEQIARQISCAIERGWAVSIEYTDDPHPRNVYWEMWGAPKFDLRDPADVVRALGQCCRAHPESYVKINAFDATSGFETVRLSFLVQRPREEARFRVARQAGPGRSIRYTIERAP